MRRWAELIEADCRPARAARGRLLDPPVRDVAAMGRAVHRRRLRFFAEYADKLGGDVAATRHDCLGMVVAEPYGVVGAITAWNFPLVMASWKVGGRARRRQRGGAEALGADAVLDHPLAELAVEAGVPAGIFNVVRATALTTGEALSRHPLIAKMTFTGSTRTGAAIMATCATPRAQAGDARARRQEPAARVRRRARSRPAGRRGRRRDPRQCRPGVRRRLAPDRQEGIAEALVDRVAALFEAAAGRDLGRPGDAAADHLGDAGGSHRRHRRPRARRRRAAALRRRPARRRRRRRVLAADD
jgi:aldehyde dehydrogenase (NAD+)